MLIIITLPSFAKEVINFDKTCDKEASKILYEYIKKEYSMSFLELTNVTKESCIATFYDLDSDGESEILGYVSSFAFQGTAGYSLYILKKNTEYEDITSIMNFYPWLGITVLDSKTEKYYDLSFYGNKQKIPIVVKYNKKWQYYEYFSSD